MEARWRETWQLLGLAAPAEILRRLEARYGEQHRAYHDLQHVLDCLAAAAVHREIQLRPAAVDLALWFHDVVYDPWRSDNEERSAGLAEAELSPLLPHPFVDAVCSMIRDTRHAGEPSSPDGAVVADIDLSILGASTAAFDAYRAAIRREYSWVPERLYRRRRREVLEGFLARERIFATPAFHDRYEAAARANLRRALDEL